MTNINTIIEEEKKEFEKLGRILLDEKELEGFGLIQTFTGGANQEQIDFLTSAMQRAYKYGVQNTRADWLRSEIEKLEGAKYEDPRISKHHAPIGNWTDCEACRENYRHNQFLDTIITRHKEELLELEK